MLKFNALNARSNLLRKLGHGMFVSCDTNAREVSNRVRKGRLNTDGDLRNQPVTGRKPLRMTLGDATHEEASDRLTERNHDDDWSTNGTRVAHKLRANELEDEESNEHQYEAYNHHHPERNLSARTRLTYTSMRSFHCHGAHCHT
jgi:hypothetical protein